MKLQPSFVAIATVVLAMFGVVQATTLLPMSTEELVRRSDAVVVATVDKVSHGFNPDHGYAETLYRFKVENSVYGVEKNTPTLTLALPGGPAGEGLVTVVPGMPVFKTGESAILFLVCDTKRNTFVPTGLNQGVIRVLRNKRGDRYCILDQTRDLSYLGDGIDFVDEGTNKTADMGAVLKNIAELSQQQGKMAD